MRVGACRCAQRHESILVVSEEKRGMGGGGGGRCEEKQDGGGGEGGVRTEENKRWSWGQSVYERQSAKKSIATISQNSRQLHALHGWERA